jgi:FtsZ-interacting cell division protein YlmF
MGLFDIWNKKEREDGSEKVSFNELSRESGEPLQNGPVNVYNPKGYGDVENIIDALKRGEQALVHLEMLKPATLIRVLDMLSGAIYAMNGGICEVGKNTYLLTPTGVKTNA